MDGDAHIDVLLQSVYDNVSVWWKTRLHVTAMLTALLGLYFGAKAP